MSFPRYPTYKPSGVEWLGEVPEHWEVLPIKRDLDFMTSGSRGWAENYSDDGEFFIRIGNLTRDGIGLDLSDVQRVLVPAGAEGARTKVRPGDVLFSVTAYLGSVAVVPDDLESAYVSQHIALVRLRQSRFSPRWVAYGSLSTVGKTWFETNAYGGTKIQLSLDDVEGLLMTAPPMAEQTTIASFLDRETAKIDGLVGEQRRLIELLKEKRQAVISHAVTKGLNPHAPLKPSGIEWLGEVPEHWEVMRLKHVKSADKNAFVDGPFGSNLKSEHFIDDGDAYVIESGFATQGRLDVADLKTISLKHFETVSRSETKGGDIIIAKIGAQFGKSSILPPLDKPAVVSGNSLKLTINPKRCEVKFVNWHLTNLKQLGAIDDIVNRTAQPALALGEMNNLSMLVPPLDEQRGIVTFLKTQLRELDALTAEAERAIELLQERRSALISAAVTGKIDVRGLAAMETA